MPGSRAPRPPRGPRAGPRRGRRRSTLTNVLDRLENRALVRRELNPADRRSFVIHLTARGERAGDRVIRVQDELERADRASITEGDVRGVDAVVTALATIVQARARGR